MAHASAWGDVDGDGWADLVVGTFADRPEADYQVRDAAGPAPDRLLLGGPDGFHVDETFPEMRGRTSGAVFADLDSDGDLDLVLARNVPRGRRGERQIPSMVLENEEGTFEVVTTLAEGKGARSVGVLDFDGDGLLDLFLVEDRFVSGASAIYRNVGGLSFEDQTAATGIPTSGVHGLGVAVADLDANGWTDLFVAGSNRLFLNDGGHFREADSSVFAWEIYSDEDDVAGAAVGDLDRDGRPDLVLGQHYNSTVDLGRQVPLRVYRNLGTGGAGGDVGFEDVTASAEVVALPTKAPHVEIADLDNDGWPDIVTSASAEMGSRPAVLRNLGGESSSLRFAAPEGLGDSQYWVNGGTADFDHDGRLDLFLTEFEAAKPSLLLRNSGPAGHWLEVVVGGPGGGVGAVVDVYRAGALGEADALLGRTEIGVTVGYGSGREAVARFGLGSSETVDLRIKPQGREPLELVGVSVDQRVVADGDCPTRPVD